MRHFDRIKRLAERLAASFSAKAAPLQVCLEKPTGIARAVSRRSICIGIMALIFSSWQGAALAQAQPFPSRPVRIIVPFAAGASADAVARAIARELSLQWNQPVIVDNRPGGNTIIGTELVARSAPDGHTLLLTSDDTFTVLPHLFKNLPFDPLKDLVMVNIPVKVAMLIVANSAVPVDTLPALIAGARAKPRTFSYGSYGIGSNVHLMMEMLNSEANIDILHVAYKGVAQSTTAVVAGEVQFGMSGYGTVRGMIENGRLKPIAVAGPERIPQLPNTPTTAELGYPAVDATVWWGLAVPAKTPVEIVNKLNDAISHASKSPEMRKVIETRNLVNLNLGPKASADRIAREFAARREVVRRSGAKVE